MAALRKKIGVRVDDYRLDVRDGLRRARHHAFTAVELAADRGEVTPENLTETGRRHLARIVTGEGLSFDALASESGASLADSARVDEIVYRTRQALRLAADMRVPILSHEVGELLNLAEAERERVVEALRELGAEAERVGTVYAIRSRLCRPEDLAQLVQTVACPLVHVSIDPGALLKSGFDPVEAVAKFGEQVMLAYVRDATRGTPQIAGEETALGDGRLDLAGYLATLQACGYQRAPLLHRTRVHDPAGEIAADKAVLDAHIPG